MVAIVLLLLLISEFSSRTVGQEGNSSIPLGSSLSPTGSWYWSSPSGQFAFGFYRQGNGSYFSIQQNFTKNIPMDRESGCFTTLRRCSIHLTSDGKIIVQTNQGKNIPIVDSARPPASSASLLDDGNFVLYANSSSSIIWQSFDSPTDTLLPGQPLLMNKNLVSIISDTNHSAGKFQPFMLSNGNMVQYPTTATTGPGK